MKQDLEAGPGAFSFTQGFWDGPFLAHHIEEKHGIHLSVRQCQRLFHKLGYTLLRPWIKPEGANPQARETFKKLQVLLADPGVEIWYGEEVHFHLHTTITRMWASKGRQPEIPSKPGRAKVGLFDAINPATGELFFKEFKTLIRKPLLGFSLSFMRGFSVVQ